MPVYFSRGLIADDGTILNAPAADGTSGQAITTDGSGSLSFATVGGGDISGSTASAPSPAADGDSDTGLFSDTADTLSMAAGGVEGLRIEESAGDISVQILPDPSQSYTFAELNSTADAALRIGVNQANAGIVTKHTDAETGNGALHIGCYDEFGGIIFEVSDGSITLNAEVSLTGGSDCGAFVANGNPAFTVGNDKNNNDFPLLVQRSKSSPDPGVMVQFDVRADSGGSSGTNAGDITHRWVDSTATYKAGFDLAAEDSNGRRVAFSWEADGSAPRVGFLGATASARESVAADATDLASAITLVNDLKAKFITKGLIS